MVSFSCDGCGEVVKKPKALSHVQRCYNAYSLSCIDCNSSFQGDEWKQHNTCISEAEKYQKALYKGKKTQQSPATPKVESDPKKRKLEDVTTSTEEIVKKDPKKETDTVVEEDDSIHLEKKLKWSKYAKRYLKKQNQMKVEELSSKIVEKLLVKLREDLSNSVMEKIKSSKFLKVKEESGDVSLNK